MQQCWCARIVLLFYVVLLVFPFFVPYRARSAPFCHGMGTLSGLLCLPVRMCDFVSAGCGMWQQCGAPDGIVHREGTGVQRRVSPLLVRGSCMMQWWIMLAACCLLARSATCGACSPLQTWLEQACPCLLIMRMLLLLVWPDVTALRNLPHVLPHQQGAVRGQWSCCSVSAHRLAAPTRPGSTRSWREACSLPWHS